jgi:hypothetical protein
MENEIYEDEAPSLYDSEGLELTEVTMEKEDKSVGSVSKRRFNKWEVEGNASYPTGTQTTITELEPGYYKIGYNNNNGRFYTV